MLVLAVVPQLAAEETAPFELRWVGSGAASLTITPQEDGSIVVSSSLPLEDASVPLSDVFCIQNDDSARERCKSVDWDTHIRLLSMKWVVVDDARHLFVAWSVPHTCDQFEPTHYFKVVDGSDFTRQLGFAGKSWRPFSLVRPWN